GSKLLGVSGFERAQRQALHLQLPYERGSQNAGTVDNELAAQIRLAKDRDLQLVFGSQKVIAHWLCAGRELLVLEGGAAGKECNKQQQQKIARDNVGDGVGSPVNGVVHDHVSNPPA